MLCQVQGFVFLQFLTSHIHGLSDYWSYWRYFWQFCLHKWHYFHEFAKGASRKTLSLRVLIHDIKFVGMHWNFGHQKLSAENDIFIFLAEREKSIQLRYSYFSPKVQITLKKVPTDQQSWHLTGTFQTIASGNDRHIWLRCETTQTSSSPGGQDVETALWHSITGAVGIFESLTFQYFREC